MRLGPTHRLQRPHDEHKHTRLDLWCDSVRIPCFTLVGRPRKVAINVKDDDGVCPSRPWMPCPNSRYHRRRPGRRGHHHHHRLFRRNIRREKESQPTLMYMRRRMRIGAREEAIRIVHRAYVAHRSSPVDQQRQVKCCALEGRNDPWEKRIKKGETPNLAECHKLGQMGESDHREGNCEIRPLVGMNGSTAQQRRRPHSGHVFIFVFTDVFILHRLHCVLDVLRGLCPECQRFLCPA